MNRWDCLLLLLLFVVLFFFGWAGQKMATPYALGDPLELSLNPWYLPFYALRTVLRMFLALILSLIFTLIVGTVAAKHRRAEQLIIPAIDILQSVPVLSFLAITITGFIHFFPGSLLGPECASIFAIFTSQVWNITFSFYQSLKGVPDDLRQMAATYQLSPWQVFWKVEIPCSMPGLLWNMMVSMSAGWFFVVYSEAMVVANQTIRLPGVGSYIALAIEQRNLLAVGYAILSMVVVIFLYDQLFFRPLIAWSEKFKLEATGHEEEYQSWLLNLMRSSRFTTLLEPLLHGIRNYIINAKLLSWPKPKRVPEINFTKQRVIDWGWNLIFGTVALILGDRLLRYVLTALNVHEIWHVFVLGSITGLRVIVLIILSSCIWVPIGVWIGQRPIWVQKIQPIIQFVAAFPANLFYPLFVIAIVKWHLNVNIWVAPLMILGTQWYILFNVISGASMFPRDLVLAADNYGVTGWQWWKRLALPSIFPYYITGAITAAGGAWNASIVAESVSWGNTTLQAVGLGDYIRDSTMMGDFKKLALGTTMMCLYVLLFNHVIWRPLYRLAEERFNIRG